MSTLTHPVAVAVEPLRKDAIERAKRMAESRVMATMSELEEAGWDANKVAPYPNSLHCSKQQYRDDLQKYSFVSQITKLVGTSYRKGEQRIVKMDSKGIEKYLEETCKQASLQYDKFITKMINKIGDCKSVYISGSHVWGYSFLTVNKANSIETWKTQQIVNFSSLGLPFNQWPSRRVK